MGKIIDIHTHAFPDKLAPRAMRQLHAELEHDVPSYHDGTIAGLLKSMDKAGVDISIVSSVSTKPGQFQAILNWSRQIQTDRIIPFVSMYPKGEETAEKLRKTKENGFKGVKIHPYYQDFNIDDDDMTDFYRTARDLGLIILTHAGYDIAFDRVEKAGPARIAKVIQNFPDLKIIATHLGSWQQWPEFEQTLLGKNVYIDTSFCFQYLDKSFIKKVLETHPPEKILFGTDSPWDDQAYDIDYIKNLGLKKDLTNKILGQNAQKLLNLM